MSLKSPYASLSQLGTGRYEPMGGLMQMFNTQGTQFSTPMTDAVNNNIGSQQFPVDDSYVSPASLPQSPSLLETLKGWIPGGFLDSTDAAGIKTQGWGGPALGVVSGLGNAYMGMQQLNLAKETLANNKRQFDMNWGAQKQLTNNRIRGKWADQNAASGGKGPSEEEYMKTRRIA